MISSKTNNIIKLSMIILAILSILPGCRAANSITRIIIDEGETDRMELAYKYESGRCSEDELERYIGTMPEVESAYVSMAGSTAIINLSLNDKFTDDKILQIKETVTESVAALSNAPPHVVVN
ncbi:MAG: hypothetical protein FWC95_06475, partial [Defluviitaleaceae bacterium]|nr:hypothetical protein [Defluviitaleaceae bacterium]